jgi:hypothetical protein
VCPFSDFKLTERKGSDAAQNITSGNPFSLLALRCLKPTLSSLFVKNRMKKPYLVRVPEFFHQKNVNWLACWHNVGYLRVVAMVYSYGCLFLSAYF